MARKYSNTFAETTLTGSISNSATTITIGSTSGLPASFPYTLAVDYGTASVEMVTVTALAGSSLTVTRGQDGTSAQSHTAGARVVHPVTARDLSEPQVHIDASSDVHGLSGGASVAGTSSTQTLTNKTISGAANTLSNIPNSAIIAVSADKVTQPFAALTVAGANGSAQVVTVTGDEGGRSTPVATIKRGGIGLLVDEDAVVDVSSDLSIDVERPHLAAALTARMYIKATTKIGALIQRVAAQVQDLFQIVTEGGANLFKVSSTGAVTSAASITAGTSLNGATLATTGAATIGGTLGVTGALTASGGVAATGAVTATTNVTATATVTGATVNGTTDIQANGESLPRGYIGSATHSVGYDTGASSTEILGPTITFTAVAGRRYKITYAGGYVGNNAGDAMKVRCRYLAGASLTTSGTVVHTKTHVITFNSAVMPYAFTAIVSGISAGQTTIGLTVQRSSGSGAVNLYADATSDGLLVLEDIGD